MGWDLATVRDEGEHAFITGMLTGDTAIGATDANVEGTWRWVSDTLQFWSRDGDGSAVNGAFSAWRPGDTSGTWEPTGGTNGTTFNCARYFTLDGAWYWADYECGTRPYAYLCQGPASVAE